MSTTTHTSEWARQGRYVKYYTLDNAIARIAPFGKIGPFPTPEEAEAGMVRIVKRFPGASVVYSECCLDGDFYTDAELDSKHAETLAKLDSLGA